MQAMFIDRSEFSAHNQVIFQKLVGDEKLKHLVENKKTKLLAHS